MHHTLSCPELRKGHAKTPRGTLACVPRVWCLVLVDLLTSSSLPSLPPSWPASWLPSLLPWCLFSLVLQRRCCSYGMYRVGVIECQEKNAGFVRFFLDATSSSRSSLQLVWDAMEQMSANVEHDAAHGILPRVCEHARAKTAAQMRKGAEECAVHHDEQHAARALITMREAEKHC